MKGFRTYKIICAVLLIGYLLVNYFEPKQTDWNLTFTKEDKIPFGTYILNQRIKDILPDVKIKTSQKPIYNTLKGENLEPSNYLIIASQAEISKLDFTEMVKFMQKGNHVFIAAYQFNSTFLDTLNLAVTSNVNLKDKNGALLNFTNPYLKKEKPYQFDKGVGEQYFSKIDTNKAIVLGTEANKKPNFIKYNFGKGALYILPNPQLLTNYNLLKLDGLDYASKALSYLPKYKNLIWDEHFTKESTEDNSPLRMLYNHIELRWAYYLSLIALALYVIYEIKRRQRIIPIIERPKNTSVEFVNVVGRVYYQQRDNRDIAEKKVSYLLEHIRSKYRLTTTSLDEEFIQQLIKATEVNETTVNHLIEEILQIKKRQMVRDEDLIRLNKIIEEFINKTHNYGTRNV